MKLLRDRLYSIYGLFLILTNVGSITSLIAAACKKNELKFMGKCFCEPGWEATNVTVDGVLLSACNSPIVHIGGCECEPQDTSRSFLYNSSWFHHTGYRCTALCRWNTQVGMPISHISEWKDNQEWKQLGFYMKDLPKTRHTHMRERLDEFSLAFHRWHYLNHSNFGDLIEFGAGGYTQTRNIFEHIKVDVKSITLVDPLIYKYKEIRGCSYYAGTLRHFHTPSTVALTLSNLTVEAFSQVHKGMQYDTVVMMNVLVYSQNAFQFLQALYDMLKPGGLLIVHERWFKDSPTSSRCNTAGFFTNILQVSKGLLDHFLTAFPDTIFYSTNKTENQCHRSKYWCGGKDDEQAFWVVARKRGHVDFATV